MVAWRYFNGTQLGLVKVHVVILVIRIALIMLQSENESEFYNQNKRHISVGELNLKTEKCEFFGENTHASYFVDIFCVLCKVFYTKV